MKKKIITISREFGSGGIYIGKKLAENLGYEFYDRDLISKVADRTLLPENVVTQYNETLQKDNMVRSFYLGDTFLNDSIIKAQREIICEIAEKGNCVIVGRCANYYLKEWDHVLNVFIESDRLSRLTRICMLNNCVGVEAERLMNLYDKRRHLYYQYCTNHTWGDRMDYDIVLNSAKIGLDTCVDILTNISK